MNALHLALRAAHLCPRPAWGFWVLLSLWQQLGRLSFPFRDVWSLPWIAVCHRLHPVVELGQRHPSDQTEEFWEGAAS